MCGISVCISKNHINRAKFDAMTDIVSHRGPDDRGVYYDNNIAMGHRRLSIIDLSMDGHQPFEKIDGFVLVFNGEIYNYIEIRKELVDRGYVFKTKTDTEVIIHAYREWGYDCVNYFNGMWAFSLYDKNNKIVFCSRDRFGVKPFYYMNSEGYFLIASEIKQFFEMIEEKPLSDNDRLMRYIIRGETCAPPNTLFKNVFQLEPGYNLVYDICNFTYKKKEYFDFDRIKDSKVDYKNACKIFKSNFISSVKLRLRSDVPVGYFLSGGLDSSSIVCVADKLQKNKNDIEKNLQHTISSCYRDKIYDEQEYIDIVAKTTDVHVHKVFPDDSDFWHEINQVIWHMDEPVFSASGLSQWSVCKAAKKERLKVVLDGQGSDEQLAGYEDFYKVLLVDLLKKFKIKRIVCELKGYLENGNHSKKDALNLVVSSVKELLIPPFFDKTLKRVYYEFFTDLPFDKKQLRKALKNVNIYPSRNGKQFIKSYMKDELVNILQNLDRKTMAFSIEARDPFLDYRLVEKLYAMPFSYKIRNGWTKSILRDGLSGIIPIEIERRKTKLAFVAPIEKWINENKTFFYKELEMALDNLNIIIDSKKVLKWYEKKKSFNNGECNLIWRIIITGKWIEIFDVKVA